jgi:hypothetical protein
MPAADFRIGILYQGSKLIYEIPKGIRENMIRVCPSIKADGYGEYSGTEKRLTFHLSFFHAVVLERIQLGSISWSIPSKFTPSDLGISRKQVGMFLGESIGDAIPFTSLGHVIGEPISGGQVTDRRDGGLLHLVLGGYFSLGILQTGFSFGGSYPAPSFDGSPRRSTAG